MINWLRRWLARPSIRIAVRTPDAETGSMAVSDGDIVLVRVPNGLGEDELARLERNFRRAMPRRVRVIVAPIGVDFDIIGQPEA